MEPANRSTAASTASGSAYVWRDLKRCTWRILPVRRSLSAAGRLFGTRAVVISPVRKVVVALAGASFALTMLGEVSSPPILAAGPPQPNSITVTNVTSTSGALFWLVSSNAVEVGDLVLLGAGGT